MCSGTCNLSPTSNRNYTLMPSKPTNLLRLSLLITCAISSKVMSQFNVLQSSLAKWCDKLETTWSIELPCAPAVLLGHCPSNSFWKPSTKFALLLATDQSLFLEYCLQNLVGSVFASAHNCWPCSFLYVRFLQRSSCLSCFFRSRVRWLSGWSFAYADTSLCLLRHSISNHGWWRCCVVLVRAAGQPCRAIVALQMQSCNNCMAMSALSVSLICVMHWAIWCCRCWQYCVHLLVSCLKWRMSAHDSEVADDTCCQGNCKLSESGLWLESPPFPHNRRHLCTTSDVAQSNRVGDATM